MVSVDGRQLCFDAGTHLYMYNSGYDPAYSGLSVGIVSKALVMQWAIENGKTGFITHDEAVKNITLFAKEVLPRLREIKPVATA